jgi:hypothetical protein
MDPPDPPKAVIANITSEPCGQMRWLQRCAAEATGSLSYNSRSTPGDDQSQRLRLWGADLVRPP